MALTLIEQTSASVATPAANKNSLFFDSSDGAPKFKNDAGTVTTLATGATSAPVDAQYVTLATNGTLTNERVLTAGAGISLTDAGAGSTVTVAATIAQNSQSAAYTTVLSDANKHILHPTADNNARTFTIDSNANVAYPIGTAITFVNQINTVTIAITSDTLTLAGTGGTGSRSLAANGIATALKIGTTSWIISGTGLT